MNIFQIHKMICMLCMHIYVNMYISSLPVIVMEIILLHVFIILAHVCLRIKMSYISLGSNQLIDCIYFFIYKIKSRGTSMSGKLEEIYLFLQLNITKISGHYIESKHKIESWRNKGKMTGNLSPPGKIWWFIYWVFSWPHISQIWSKELKTKKCQRAQIKK